MKSLIRAAVVLSVFTAADVTSAEEKVPGGDASFVVTWSASDKAAGEAGDVTPLAAPAQSRLEFVAFDAACRFLDTRVAGGAFARNESRDISVLDAGLPVGLGPCGVPAGAKAVKVALSALKGSTTAIGSARLGPGGAPATLMAMQFVKGQGNSVTTTVPLSVDSKLRLTSSAAGAAYIGHLLGYYQAPASPPFRALGTVTSGGVLTSGSGVTQIQKSGSFLGDYTITFSNVITGCSLVATTDNSGTRLFSYFISSDQWFVDVRMYNSTSESDGGFNFVLQCP